MSDQAYVMLAVLGTFLAVLLTGAAVARASRSRRSARVLQGQLESAGVQVAPSTADASFSQRVVVPAIATFSRAAARITPSGLRAGVARRLVLAGSSGRWAAEAVLALARIRSQLSAP